jgi:hypothetical protein
MEELRELYSTIVEQIDSNKLSWINPDKVKKFRKSNTKAKLKRRNKTKRQHKH